MKILWFTNILLPDAAKEIGEKTFLKGGWMSSLASVLVENNNIELAIVSTGKIRDFRKFTSNKITYYVIPLKSQKNMQTYPTRQFINYCKRTIDDFKPNIVHIHGTENCYGLLSADGHINVPTIISIQGIINDYIKYYFGGVSCWDILRTYSIRDWLRCNGIFHRWMKWRKYIPLELKIFKKNKYFIGRTLWDKAHLFAVNPKSTYYNCDELMRPEFYLSDKWDVDKIKRHSIFVPTGSAPLKGLHFAIKAVSILKREYKNIRIIVPDSPLSNIIGRKANWLTKLKVIGYGIYLFKLIKQLGLKENITVLEMLSADEMAKEMLNAHIIAIPSLVENSCNALQEAMLIGTPCVVSYAGGMGSIVNDGETALCFPPGDETVLAECIRKIFLDDGLAGKISTLAQQDALKRNSKEIILNRMLEIYKDVLKDK